MQNVLFGLLFIEAKNCQKDGTSFQGSKKLTTLLDDTDSLSYQDIHFILESIQKVGYQGHLEFAICTILNTEFLRVWQSKVESKEFGIKVLGNLRALYQNEVDNILQELDKELWQEIRKFSYSSNPEELSDIGYRHWIMVGTAMNITIMKISGMMLVQLAYSNNEDEFTDRAIRTLLSLFFEPERINIFHIQYGYAHDPNWNLFEKFEINPNLLNQRPELHQYYRDMCIDIVNTFKRGILYNEL